MALITKRDTVLTTVSLIMRITEADENAGAVLASVDGSYAFVINETFIVFRPFLVLHSFYHKDTRLSSLL